MNTIITIGREFGSGGRVFGRRLAEEYILNTMIKKLLKQFLNTHLCQKNMYNK